jgi:predicted AlkP superfamily phosphohydrolase/phosphomutase/Tfp pilus assembly protein PilF
MKLRRIAALFLALMFASTMACTRVPPGGKVIVLGLDSLDPLVIDTMLAEGKLPTFAKLRQRGAYGRLTSMRPLLSPIIWTTIATGREPSDHRIGHFVAVNPATGEKLPVTSQMRKVKALWNIFSAADKDVAVVGWWATWPAEHVRGAIVSDHTCYHFLLDDAPSGARDMTGVAYPAEIASDIMPLVRRPDSVTLEELRRFADVSADDIARPFSFEDDLSHFKWALATAFSYRDIGLSLWKTRRPDLLMTYIEGVDSSSHLFGHLFRNTNLSGELAEQQRRYGETVERMYELADDIVGRYLEAMDADTTLVVVSDHGFELGALHGDPSKTRDMRRVSEQFHRIEGIVYLYGRGVRAGTRIDRASILDITPTVLALAGLPAATDMPGRVLDEALTLPVPAPRVQTYETPGARADLESATRDAAAAPVDPGILAHLESLGYLDAASPSGDRNLAAMHFAAGRFDEATKAYRSLVEADPDDAALRASLAGALGATGDYDAALVELDRAEKLAPLNPEIYHNRGVILERRGDTAEAVSQYKRAVRYSPDYEPSRAALARLTGSPDPSAPSTDTERAAASIAARASAAAQRGDYAGAMAALDEAERTAPDYALVHQYRANVAFLMGDRERAVAALRKALEIEPDNALFRNNLEAMQKAPAAPRAPQ